MGKRGGGRRPPSQKDKCSVFVQSVIRMGAAMTFVQLKTGVAQTTCAQVRRGTHAMASVQVPVRRFRNEGNACYLNTALQLLGANTMLLHSLREHRRCNMNCIACWLRHDLVDFPAQPFEPMTSIMRKAFERPNSVRWSQRRQEDCSEFIGAIQDLLHATDSAACVHSAFLSSFRFRLEEQRRCESC